MKNPHIRAQVESEDMLEVLREMYLQQPRGIFGGRAPLHLSTLNQPEEGPGLYESRTPTYLEFSSMGNFLNLYAGGGCCPRGGNVPVIKSISNS